MHVDAMKFKDVFEKCQAMSSKDSGDDTLADQVTKMTTRDDITTEGSTLSQDDNRPKENSSAKKLAAAADDKSDTEDSDKTETNI